MVNANLDRNVHVGARVYLRRTDGSKRIHEATCMDIYSHSLALRAQAPFVVGEVVELVSGESSAGEFMAAKAHRARVMYRVSDCYGLRWLGETNVPPKADATAAAARLAAARKLLADLKAAYDTLPAAHRVALRETLTDCANGCPDGGSRGVLVLQTPGVGKKESEAVRPSLC